jgi:gliding motility-associated-like protein
MDITQFRPLSEKLFACIVALTLQSFIPTHTTDVLTPPVEICNNAIDDDGDGLIDLNDPDCECEIIEPVSLIPNPSFEEMSCCPLDRSQLYCADAWVQASEPTTDYLHTCGWMGWDDFPPPLPFPDGQGAMGFRDGRVRQTGLEPNWKEYAGSCLLSPLEAGTSYLFEFYVGFVNNLLSPPINITFFGTTDCNNLPFGVGDEGFGCPTNGPGWVRLGSSSIAGGSGSNWVKTSIEVIPEEDITAIVIGPDCPSTLSLVSTYYFFDNLVLADLRSFQFVITEIGHPCEEGFLLRVPEEPDLDYQWYKDGIALVGEILPQLSQMYGEGDYQVRIMDDESCKVSLVYPFSVPFFNQSVTRVICEEDDFPFGNLILDESGFYVDTFKTANNCDSIVYLDLTVLGVLADTVNAKIFEGESYKVGAYNFNKEGDHLVNLIATQGCDSLVLLQLEYYHIFIPNVFSPNDDGSNDLFSVFGGDGLIEDYELIIFDRWGTQIYKGEKWDGRYKGAAVESGVFAYIAKLKMNDGIERKLAGSVTVVR